MSRLLLALAALAGCAHSGTSAAVQHVDAATASILSYGARGDGSDDRAAIQAALNANVGGVVTVPAGRWFIGRAGSAYYGLAIPAGTTLQGEGAASVLVQLAGVDGSVRLLELDAPGATVQDLALDGQRALQPRCGAVECEHRAGAFVRAAGATFRRVTSSGFSGDGLYFYTGANGLTIDSVTATGNGRNGLTLGGTIDGVTVTSSTFRGNAAQQFDSEPGTHVDHVTITGSTFDGGGASGDYVLTICGSAGAQSTGWDVSGSTINGALYVVWASDVSVHGNTGLNPTAKSWLVYRHAERVTLDGNVLTSAASDGIAVVGTGTGQAPSDVTIRGNTLTVGGQTGVAVSGAASVTIEANTITRPAGHGAAAVTVRATNPSVPMVSATLRSNRATGFDRGLGVAGMIGNTSAVAQLTASGNILGGDWYLDEGSGALQSATLTDNADHVARWPAGAVVVTSSTTTMTRGAP